MNANTPTRSSHKPADNSSSANTYPATPFGARMAGLALAAVFTLGTLLAVAGLASVDTTAQLLPSHMAEQVPAQHSS